VKTPNITAAREDQECAGGIDSLKDKLSRAYFIERSNLLSDTAVFGARVKVKDLDLPKRRFRTGRSRRGGLRPEQGFLTNSPIGQGLLGKKKRRDRGNSGSHGQLRFKILEISFPDA